MHNTPDLNPLLDFSGLPQFDRITPAHVNPAMDALLAQAQAALHTVTEPNFAANWQAIAQVLDVATERLSRAWGVVNHLHSVVDTPELRAAYNEALPKVTQFLSALGSNEALYAKYKAIAPGLLNAEQAQAHQQALRHFVLSGAELAGPARERFLCIQERQAQLGQQFGENTLDATQAFVYNASADEVAGLPPDALEQARQLAAAKGHEGYQLSLHMPSYLPVMQFAHNRDLRETMYRAYSTRASDQAAPAFAAFDNSAVIQEILALRQEEAQLLGFADFGALSLMPKMAQSTSQVLDFLRDLAQRARPFAEKDWNKLQAFAREHLGLADLKPWDYSYAAEKLKEADFSFSEQEVKLYFPLPKVLQGLFNLVETLFEVTIAQDHAPVWAPGVGFYKIERGNTLLGQFYLDPSARPGKRSGAWMDDARTRWQRPDTQQLQTPVAYLVCNFASGSESQPALLTHDDVMTLFHEFGHGLHHLLTQVREHDVAGISGVEWDAVELPSQFMENFCWEWSVLEKITAHVDTGQSLPRPLFEKMLRAKNFQAGMQTLRQVELALFDMLLHSQSSNQSQNAPQPSVLSLLEQVHQEVAVLPAWPTSRPAHTFGHIFAGGYAAGYYSYKWAEVLSADVYAAFEEAALEQAALAGLQAGVVNTSMGRKYRQEILEVGGSRPAMASFKAFRGREPRIDALLRHQGMA